MASLAASSYAAVCAVKSSRAHFTIMSSPSADSGPFVSRQDTTKSSGGELVLYNLLPLLLASPIRRWLTHSGSLFHSLSQRDKLKRLEQDSLHDSCIYGLALRRLITSSRPSIVCRLVGCDGGQTLASSQMVTIPLQSLSSTTPSPPDLRRTPPRTHAPRTSFHAFNYASATRRTP